jgi:long-chain acyl-CoA synthetase
VYEGYGLTETSPVVSVNTLNRPGMLRVGCVGKLVEGVEVRFAEDGEILVRGHNIMQGYYKEPEMTADVLKDGWFHTGDIGVMEGGFLKITDRKKEMFKTSGGKYVAPQLLENAIKASRFIEQVMVVGDGRKTPGALVVPDAAGMQVWCERHGHPFPGLAGIADDPVLVARIAKDVEDLMEPFAPWERVKLVRVLREPFTIDAGELTPTLKLKRKPIAERYAAEIDALYAG